jgi:hypothetical protein
MDKKTMMYVGIGVGVVALLYFMRKPEEEIIEDAPILSKREKGERMGAEINDVPATTQPVADGNSINISNSINNSWIGIPSNQRNKATASLQIGTQGSINGTGSCTITDFWLDSNDKFGAFKCDDKDYYEIPGGSKFQYKY